MTTAERDDRATKRPYRSRLRQEQSAATRQAILEAASTMFLGGGWAGTGVRAIAAAAGVSAETVYAHFGSKTGLLRALLDQAAVGDDEQVALAERPEFRAIGEGGRSARIAAAARLATGINVRIAALLQLLREAARSDPDLAELFQDSLERRRTDSARGVAMAIGREPTKAERDGSWAVTSPEVYLLLVADSGWTPEEYEQWLAHLLERITPLS